jgi:hypothetical protein
MVFNEALITAIARDEVESVQILLDQGANIDQFKFPKANRKEEVLFLNAMAQRAVDVVTSIHSESRANKAAQGTEGKASAFAKASQGRASGVTKDESAADLEQTKVVLRCWGALLAEAKVSPDTRHVKAFFAKAKHDFEDVQPGADMQLKPNKLKAKLPVLWEPLQKDEQKHYYSIFSSQALLLKRREGECLSDHHRTSLGDAGQGIATALAKCADALLELKVTRHLLLLQGIYEDILGPLFRYKMGMEGSAHFDLFLWCVLQNRKSMAEVFFKGCNFPVRCALTAACLLRSMKEKSCVDPQEADEMEATASEFENLAIAVQLQAEAEDRSLSVQALNVPLGFWRDPQRLMDLAVAAECDTFVEKCCSAALDDQFTGDLKPYGDKHLNFKICVTIMSIGIPLLIWPDWINFQPPPRTEQVRSATQRRKSPKGYPFQPRSNPKLKAMYADFLESKRPADDTESARQLKAQAPRGGANSAGRSSGSLVFDKNREFAIFGNRSEMEGRLENKPQEVSELAVKLSAEMKSSMDEHKKKAMRWMHLLENEPNFALNMTGGHLQALWEPTFTGVERWKLFFQAPKVMYMLNILTQIAVICLFALLHVVINQQAVDEQELFGYPLPSNCTIVIQWVLACYFISSFVREILQVALSLLLSSGCSVFTTVFTTVFTYQFLCPRDSPVPDCRRGLRVHTRLLEHLGSLFHHLLLLRVAPARGVPGDG